MVAEHAAGIGRGPPGEVARQNLRLLVGRLDQAIAGAAMLGAFADREDVGHARHQLIIDDDAAIDGEAGGCREFGIGSDAGRDHDGVGGNPRPSVSSTRLDGIRP